MTTLALGLVAGVVGGYSIGGRLRSVASLYLPIWLPVAVGTALALQFGLGRVGGRDVELALLIGTYLAGVGCIGAYAAGLWRRGRNRPLQLGVQLLALGWLLNFLVIATNGGMPVPREDFESAEGTLLLKHVPITEDTRLRFLGDVISIGPLREQVSAGDLALALGLALFVGAAMRKASRYSRESTGSRRLNSSSCGVTGSQR